MWPKSKSKPNPGVRTVPPPAGRPRAKVKERVGRAASFSSSAMSSGRLFLDRVARQHCPSPLHRRSQINMHLWDALAKDDMSNLPGRRHFYFALTVKHPRLTPPPNRSILSSMSGSWIQDCRARWIRRLGVAFLCPLFLMGGSSPKLTEIKISPERIYLFGLQSSQQI